GADDRGCAMRLKGDWLRLTCPATTPGGKRLLDVVSGYQCAKAGEGLRCTSGPTVRLEPRARSLDVDLLEDEEVTMAFLWEDEERSFDATRAPGSAEPAGGFSVPAPVAAADGARLVRIADCCV